jgi:hypothetical protein
MGESQRDRERRKTAHQQSIYLRCDAALRDSASQFPLVPIDGALLRFLMSPTVSARKRQVGTGAPWGSFSHEKNCRALKGKRGCVYLAMTATKRSFFGGPWMEGEGLPSGQTRRDSLERVTVTIKVVKNLTSPQSALDDGREESLRAPLPRVESLPLALDEIDCSRVRASGWY